MGADSWNILRSQSRIRVRKQLWYNGPMHRTEIAEALSLSLPAVTALVNEWIEHGVAVEQKYESNRKQLGRKATMVDIIPQARLFIGAEMRKDSRRVCLTDYRGNILCFLEEESSYPLYQDNIRALQLLLFRLVQENGIALERVHSLGVAVPGVIDAQQGMLVSHRKYGWFNCAISDDLKSLTGWDKPIFVDNDACTRAYGMRMLHRGEMKQVNRFAYLFIARGLSCPLLPCMPADVGNPLGIGEIGYMIIQADNILTPGSITRHLSDLSGERAIMDRCHQAMREAKAPILSAICSGDARPAIPQILEAQALGDNAVQQILRQAFQYLAIAIANVCNLVQPDMIFVDSRLFSTSENQDVLTQTVQQYLIASHNPVPAFEFIKADAQNGARCAALSAIRQELNQYEEN